MIDYTIYNISTGKIRQHGTTTDLETILLEAGEDYVLGQYDAETFKIIDNEPVISNPDREPETRRLRNTMLEASDWTQMPDSPLSDADKTAWQTYRQALRDLPGHANWPDLQPSDFPNKPA